MLLKCEHAMGERLETNAHSKIADQDEPKTDWCLSVHDKCLLDFQIKKRNSFWKPEIENIKLSGVWITVHHYTSCYPGIVSLHLVEDSFT